jgi:hypothetical protein
MKRRNASPRSVPKESKTAKARHRRQPWITRRDWLLIVVSALVAKLVDGLHFLFTSPPRHYTLKAESGHYVLTGGGVTITPEPAIVLVSTVAPRVVIGASGDVGAVA